MSAIQFALRARICRNNYYTIGVLVIYLPHETVIS